MSKFLNLYVGFQTLLASTGLASSLAVASSSALYPSHESARRNCFDIFNSVHSAGRQWGSSLNHNGMAVMPSTVHQGSLFYHGTQRSREAGPPPIPEWLAFEPEHSEGFAISTKYNDSADPGISSWDRSNLKGQAVMGGSELPIGVAESAMRGYLHTYRANRDLRLLYVDGMSAGKSRLGTMDLGDFVLRMKDDTVFLDEYERAYDLCGLVADWGYDGILRMEIGFEIIYCDFFSGLDLLDIKRQPFADQVEGRTSPVHDLFLLASAAARHYDGFGSNRLSLDFSRMVSAYFYPLNLTNPDPEAQHLPRLLSTTRAEREVLRSRIVEVNKQDTSPVVDWQNVVDMIVSRYSDRLALMTSASIDANGLVEEVYRATNTYFEFPATPNDVNAMTGDDTREIEARQKCAKHYLQPVEPLQDTFTQEDELLYTAIEAVTTRICAAFFDSRALILEAQLGRDHLRLQTSGGEDEGENDLLDAVETSRRIVTELVDDLRWSGWKRCQGCSIGEICFLPMWPFGQTVDYHCPRCVDELHFELPFKDNYWFPESQGVHDGTNNI